MRHKSELRAMFDSRGDSTAGPRSGFLEPKTGSQDVRGRRICLALRSVDKRYRHNVVDVVECLAGSSGRALSEIRKKVGGDWVILPERIEICRPSSPSIADWVDDDLHDPCDLNDHPSTCSLDERLGLYSRPLPFLYKSRHSPRLKTSVKFVSN